MSTNIICRKALIYINNIIVINYILFLYTVLFYFLVDMLAYLTAKTHGLEEEAENIAASLGLGPDEVVFVYILLSCNSSLLCVS